MPARSTGSCALVLLALGCGQETRTPPASPAGTCSVATGCEPDGSGGASGDAAGGNAGSSSSGAAASSGVAGDAGAPMAGTCTEQNAAPPPPWATWPMPHPQGSALPTPASYDARLPGVVLDRVTGLMWQREPISPGSFADAEAVCSALELADFCDWRLPTRIELVSLVDFTRSAPALDALFPAGTGEFWSTSAIGNNRWRIGADGATRASSEAMAPTAAGRCVRVQTPHPLPAQHYETGGQIPNDWVKDNGTGLTWQRRVGTTKFSYAEAGPHCAAWGDGTFRVPSMKELQTLIDESKDPSLLIDTEAFPDSPTAMGATFWTSTPSANRPSHAWFLRGATMLDAAVDADLVAQFYVRCVR